MSPADLPPALLVLVVDARTAVLATVRPDGGPRLVPICFAVAPSDRTGLPADGPGAAALVVHSPIDEKPKRARDAHALARVADVLARPAVELLVERWDEDWRRLAWVRLDGTASVLEPDMAPLERRAAIGALRAKYPQYGSHDLEGRPLLRIVVERAAWWTARG